MSICSLSTSCNLYQQAYADIISKRQQGYAKQLWQTIPKGGAKAIAHPVLPAQHTTEADLIACICAAAVTPLHPALGRQAAEFARMLRETLLALDERLREIEHGEVRSHPASSSVQTTDPSASLRTKISITEVLASSRRLPAWRPCSSQRLCPVLVQWQAGYWLQALVQTALLDQADRTDPNDAHPRAQSQSGPYLDATE
ncbi:hypothetical protein WJX77_007844 [Trebouxia sp. C0004]